MAINTSYSTPVNGTAAIFSLITLLTANGWKIPAWSDATTLTTPGSPLSSNPYGSSGNGAGNLGNTNAWFRITSPSVNGNTREWLFQRGSADQTWTVSRSRTGFTTGGTASVIPTDATTGQNLLSAAQLFDAVLASRLLIEVDTVTGAWTMFTIVTGGGNTRTFVADEALAAGTFASADTDPYLFTAYYNATGATAPATIPPAFATWYKRTRNGLSGAANNTTTLAAIFNSSAVCIAPPSGTANQPAPEPYSTNEVPIQIPVYRAGATSTTTGWAGFTNGLRWNTVYGRSNGQTLTNGANYWIFVAGTWVPWDSSTPVI
jgi:hypothetical protein